MPLNLQSFQYLFVITNLVHLRRDLGVRRFHHFATYGAGDPESIHDHQNVLFWRDAFQLPRIVLRRKGVKVEQRRLNTCRSIAVFDLQNHSKLPLYTVRGARPLYRSTWNHQMHNREATLTHW